MATMIATFLGGWLVAGVATLFLIWAAGASRGRGVSWFPGRERVRMTFGRLLHALDHEAPSIEVEDLVFSAAFGLGVAILHAMGVF